MDAFFKDDFKVYDGDAFAIATSRVESTQFLDTCLVVDQTTASVMAPEFLKHNPTQLAVAIVDRTADLSQAATAIIKSKFAFQGTSPFVADIVLVNEWIRDSFVAELERGLRAETLATQKLPGLRPNENIASPKEEELLIDVNGVTVVELPRK